MVYMKNWDSSLSNDTKNMNNYLLGIDLFRGPFVILQGKGAGSRAHEGGELEAGQVLELGGEVGEIEVLARNAPQSGPGKTGWRCVVKLCKVSPPSRRRESAGAAAVKSIRDYLRISQAAECLGVSPQTLRNWERDGKIRCYRHPVSQYRLFRKRDLEALLRALEGSGEKSKRAKGGAPGSEGPQKQG